MEQVKSAPKDFFVALAVLIADMKLTAAIPLKMLLGILSFIPKSGKRWRGIRRGSILAKIVERVMAHPLFPCFGPPGKLVCNEQFAGIRGLSSDLAALSLSIMISVNEPTEQPLFLLFTDFDGAYDSVWREALFAKLAANHPDLLQVKQIVALYEKMQSVLKEGGYTSELIESLLGVPQGGPNSGHLFTAFISDLPHELRASDAGIELFGLLILCLMFMDDVVIPLRSAESVQTTLDALYSYGCKWFLSFNAAAPPNAKTKVLCRYAPNAPRVWRFGPVIIHTVDDEQYLSVTYTSDGKWNAHFKQKIARAKKKSNVLRRAGLLGGTHSPAAASMLVSSVVWSSLDSGRIATDISGPGYQGLRKELLLLQLRILREVLNLSSKAPIGAVVGELAVMLDHFRDEMQLLQALRRMLAAPQDSVPALLIRQCLSSAQHAEAVPFVERSVGLLTTAKVNTASENLKSHIKKQCWSRAEADWRTRVKQNDELALIYPAWMPFRIQPYLQLDAFPGRTRLSMLRANDLALEAAGYNTKKGGLCLCCGLAPETRQHFLLHCPALQPTRDVFPGLVNHRIQDDAQRMRDLLLCLSIPPIEVESRARALGEFLIALWRERGILLGKYQRFYP